jgi:DNA-binding NarL/FixJ family response regulator
LCVEGAGTTTGKGARAVKRIFILSSGSIFGEGVQRLVGRETGLEVVGSETDLSLAVERIRELQPDVVIVDEDRWASELALGLMRLREKGSGIKVIGFSLQTNSLSCYSRESLAVRKVEDLMQALK